MHLHALSTAIPPQAFTQQECWEIVRQSPARQRLSRRSMLLLQAILRGDSGVRRRHFATTDVARLFDCSADELNAAYRRAAPELAATALKQALAATGDAVGEIDALFVCSCTGYLCPGVTSYVAERMGVRADAFLLDVMGHGCGAALPMLRAAHDYLAVHPQALVATVAVEICSAAFYLDDDPGVIVSACIFSDGAAAALWRSRPGPVRVKCEGFSTLHRPEARDLLRFEQRDGKLRNLLDAAVPQLAADSVRGLCPADAGPHPMLVVHPGGREVITAVEAAMHTTLPASRTVLENYGNMSSPSVLFVLAESLRRGDLEESGRAWMTSFGAGFSVHGCHVVRTPALQPSGRALAASAAVLA